MRNEGSRMPKDTEDLNDTCKDNTVRLPVGQNSQEEIEKMAAELKRRVREGFEHKPNIPDTSN